MKLRYTAKGPGLPERIRVQGHTFELGKVTEVPEELGRRLAARPGFEKVPQPKTKKKGAK